MLSFGVCVCVCETMCVGVFFFLLTCDPLVKQEEKLIEIPTQYRETFRKSTGTAIPPSSSRSLPLPSFLCPPPSLPLSSVSSMSRPLLYLPLASHCRALRKAQTASDKVRMIRVLFSVGPEPCWDIRLGHSHCFSLSPVEYQV